MLASNPNALEESNKAKRAHNSLKELYALKKSKEIIAEIPKAN